MSSIEWDVVSETKDHRIWRAVTDYGEYTISTITAKGFYGSELSREVKLSFRPAYPEGEDFMSFHKKLQELKAANGGEWTMEMDRMHRYNSPIDVGNFQSWFEALLMVELLDKGDAGLPDPVEMLLQNGFEETNCFTYEDDREVRIYRDSKRSALHCDISTDGTIAYHLDNNRGWYNLGRLTGDHPGQRDRKWIVQVIWPPQVSDFRKVAVQHLLRIRKLREQRGGLFRKPLSGEEECLKGAVSAAV